MEPGLEEGDFVFFCRTGHVGDRDVGNNFVPHSSELGDLLGNEILVTLVMEREEGELGLGGSLIIGSGHGVVEAGIFRT